VDLGSVRQCLSHEGAEKDEIRAARSCASEREEICLQPAEA
jgi:hypothetical protein